MPTTEIARITDKLQYIPKSFTFPKITTEYYIRQNISYIIAIIKDLPKTLPFLSYGDPNNNAINQISHIFHISISQPCFPILHVLPMLTQIYTQVPFLDIINHPAAPAARLEPVVQPPRVQPYITAPKLPPRVQHAPPPTLDPFTNPWI